MKRFTKFFSVYTVLGLMVLGLAGPADAQWRNEREVRDIVRNLNSKVDDFKYNLEYQLKSSSADQQAIRDISNDLGGLQDSISAFETNLDGKSENRDDIAEIVDAAKTVASTLASTLASNPLNRKLEADWAGIRGLLDRLANSYNVPVNWNTDTSSYPNTTDNNANFPAPSRSTSFSNGLTGTYQLDTSRSENTADIVSRSNVGTGQKQDLESKLEAPGQIAISIRGDQVSLASTKASPITFTADGREKTENISGGNVRVRATLRGQELTVSSLGGETDYTVTFTSIDNGKTLKVTRRITTDYLQETVFAESIYNKTDAVAQLGIDSNSTNDDGTYSSNDPGDRNAPYGSGPGVNQNRVGEFIVPNGTNLTGILDNEIDTKISQNNDRFRLTVQTPDEFRGAIIEGYLSGVGRSGQVSGRSNITFNFQRITLRNGKAYDFAGNLQSVKDTFGKEIKVDTEGTAKGESQTKETAVRGGIGAGLGAIIGAIAGGGKGAAIGAIIGGGAGAGSVVVQGRDDIKLQKGSTVTVAASSPIRRDQPLSEN